MNSIWIGIICIIIIVSFLICMHDRKRTLNILEEVDKMLEEAEKGEFCEADYSETMLSRVEARMAHYIGSCEVSHKYLVEEKDNIKRLISDISHQTKTPIANILLYGEMLKEQPLTQESKELVDSLNKQTEKLNFLIQALVKTSRLENGIMKVIPEKQSLVELFQEVENQISHKALEKQISLQVSCIDCEALFDRKWTIEALYNIVDNAVKYTKPGGRIDISATCYTMFVCINVTDNGIGIKEEEFSKIFGRFYRSYDVREQEGLGIGLYLARQIISSEGGYIKVASEIGKGSVFSVYLPLT